MCARARTCVCDCGCADSLPLHAPAHTCATCVYQARRGDNWVVVEGKLDVAAQDLVKVSQLFSALLGGKHVTMLASLASSDNPIVAAGLAGVFLNTSVAAPPIPLLAPAGIQLLGCSIVPVEPEAVRLPLLSRPRAALPLSGAHPNPRVIAPRVTAAAREQRVVGLREGEASQVSLRLNLRIAVNNPLGPNSVMNISSLSASEVSLVYKHECVAVLVLPPQPVPPEEQGESILTITVATVARVTNAGFARLVSDFMAQDNLEITLAAKISANVTTALGPLAIADVPVSQAMVLPGAGGFQDVQVLSFDVAGRAQQVLGVSLKARIWNPSNLAASLGAVSMELLFHGECLGQVFTANLELAPGANVLEFSGAVLPQSASGVDALGTLVAGYLRGDVVEPSVRGVRASSFSAPWLQEAIAALHLSVPLRQEQRQPLLQDITFENLSIRFADQPAAGVGETGRGAPAGPSALVTVKIRARLVLPFSLEMNVESADLRLFISGQGAGGQVGRAFAYVEVQGASIDCDARTREANITLRDEELVMVDEDAMADFVGQLFNEALVTLAFQGNVSVTALMQFGSFRVPDVPVWSSVVSHGMAGLTVLPVRVTDVRVMPAPSPQELPVAMSVALFNPSDLEIALGDVSFDLFLADCAPQLPAPLSARGGVSAGVAWRGAKRRRGGGGDAGGGDGDALGVLMPGGGGGSGALGGGGEEEGRGGGGGVALGRGGRALGEIMIRGFVLQRGWNNVEAVGKYFADAGPCGETFLSQYINGQVAILESTCHGIICFCAWGVAASLYLGADCGRF